MIVHGFPRLIFSAIIRTSIYRAIVAIDEAVHRRMREPLPDGAPPRDAVTSSAPFPVDRA